MLIISCAYAIRSVIKTVYSTKYYCLQFCLFVYSTHIKVVLFTVLFVCLQYTQQLMSFFPKCFQKTNQSDSVQEFLQAGEYHILTSQVPEFISTPVHMQGFIEDFLSWKCVCYKGRMCVLVHPLGFCSFNEILDIFKDKNRQIQL